MWSSAKLAGRSKGVSAPHILAISATSLSSVETTTWSNRPDAFAAMIAWAGIERFKINLTDNLEFISRARWPLDSNAPFMKGAGLKL